MYLPYLLVTKDLLDNWYSLPIYKQDSLRYTTGNDKRCAVTNRLVSTNRRLRQQAP